MTSITINSKLEEFLKARLYGLSDPKQAKDLLENALALTKSIVYTIELSWGGPADGFKVYCDSDFAEITAVKYYYADWFDYKEKSLTSQELDLIKPLLENYLAKSPI